MKPYMIPKGIPPPHLEFLVTELLFFFLVAFLCIFIYIKTKEIYSLSKHKGLHYFRNTFLFFFLAHFTRFLILWGMILHLPIARKGVALGLFLTMYFSLMAILSLIYSSFASRLKLGQIDHWLNIIAVVLSAVVFFIQFKFVLLVLVIGVIILIISRFIRKRHPSHMNILYVMLFMFWIVSLFSFIRHLSLTAKSLIFLVSVMLLAYIAYKVLKVTSNGKKKGKARSHS